MWKAKGRTEKNAGLTYTRDADGQNKCGSVAAQHKWVGWNVNCKKTNTESKAQITHVWNSTAHTAHTIPR